MTRHNIYENVTFINQCHCPNTQLWFYGEGVWEKEVLLFMLQFHAIWNEHTKYYFEFFPNDMAVFPHSKLLKGPVAQWVRWLDYLTTHTSLSPMRRGFPPSFVNYKKGALDWQPQVIKLTSCLPMAGGSFGYFGFFHHYNWPPKIKIKSKWHFVFINEDVMAVFPHSKLLKGPVAQWVRWLDYLTTHTSLSPMRRGFAPSFVNYKKGALDWQPQVIQFTSCLPMAGGSLRVLRLQLVAMV